VTGPALLSVQDLELAFGEVRVLEQVSIDIERGAVFGLIGPNGAGKTSLFNCISGLYPYDRGEIVFDGHSLRGLRPDALAALGIARSFQHPALFTGLTVLDQILVAIEARGTDARRWFGVLPGPGTRRREAQSLREATELIDALGLASWADLAVGRLSLAQRRRVEIARALAMRPRLLLLDEPAAGLDEPAQRDLARLLLDARERTGLTILLIDHRIGWVRALCDRLAALHLGRVIACGETDAVCADPAVVQAYLGPVDDTVPLH
jgi:branched-chain amino acid transport system ATP-binding protein